MYECYSLDIGTITTDRQAAQLQTEEAGPHPISQRCPELGREHGGSPGSRGWRGQMAGTEQGSGRGTALPLSLSKQHQSPPQNSITQTQPVSQSAKSRPENRPFT